MGGQVHPLRVWTGARASASLRSVSRFLAGIAASAVLATVGIATAVAAVGDLGEQRRISSTGTDAESFYYSERADLAYNSSHNQYLAVWIAVGPPDGGSEVIARLLGPGGEPIGDQVQISSMGPSGDRDYGANSPSVTYNAPADEYLVVWAGDDDRSPLEKDEDEIFAQRLTAAGAEVGADDQRISVMGPARNPDYDASSPAVAYNPSANEYLIAWQADNQTTTQIDGESEIFVQRLSSTGAELGTSDQRISTMGPDRNLSYDATDAEVVYNAAANEYLIAWNGDEGLDDFEIFIQRLSANGDEVGGDDQQISTMGTDGSDLFGAYDATPVYNPSADEYLVAWEGYDSPPVDAESEIFIQRLSSAGAEVGNDDQVISAMGPPGDDNYGAFSPSAVYNPTTSEYLVTWAGSDDTPPSVQGKDEIFSQRLSAAGAEIGADDQRVSAMGPDGDANYRAHLPTASYNAIANEYLFAWQANETYVSGAGSQKTEIFARSIAAPDPPTEQPPGTLPTHRSMAPRSISPGS